MTQNNESGVTADPLKASDEDYPSSASPDSRTVESGREEGNAFLRALFGGTQDLGNLERIPTVSFDETQTNGDEICFKLPQLSFRPFDCKIPSLVRARVTRKIGRKLYMVRDVETLTYLYEHITRPSARLSTLLLQRPDQKVPCLARVVRQFSEDKQRRSNPRLYRGIASNFNCDNSSCTVYLVDYGEQVDCSAFLVYDLSNQASQVLETQAAAFKFQINGVLLDGNCCKVDFELKDNCNYDLRLTGKEGEVFMGFVCMQSEMGTGGLLRVPHLSKHEDGDRKLKELKELEKKRAELDEKTKNLRTERQLFELQASERQQELMLMMIQLQCAQVSQKIDMIASNALYRSSMGACWNPGAPMFPLMVPPYGHYPVGMPMMNQLVQSMENNSIPQLQNGQFSAPSAFPTLANQQYQFLDGLSRQPVPTDNAADNVNSSARNVNSTEQEQPVPETIAPRRSQGSDTCTVQSGPNPYRGNSFSSQPPSSRKMFVRPKADDYQKGDPQNSSTTQNKLCLSPSYLDAKRDAGPQSREHRKPEYGEPPRFLMDCTSPSKKQAAALQSRTDAFTRTYRNDRSSNAFSESGKILEFRNSCRPQRSMGSPRSLGKSFRQGSKKNAYHEEEEVVEPVITVTGVLKPPVAEATHIFGSESGDGAHPSPNGEKQSKGTDSSSARRRASLDLDEECVPAIIFSSGHLVKLLRYVEYIPHMDVEEGKEYLVKRSDDDRANCEWPLFFVQVQNDEILDFIAEHLDSLHSDDILPEDEVVVGKLCLSYCHAFQAMFRAVITAVMETDVEVHYIDYGNYENVTRSELRTISEQSEVTRTHKAMAVPCIIKSLDGIDRSSGDDVTEEDIAAMKEAVSCDDERSFTVRFLRKREDGVRVVELVKPFPPL